MSFQAIRDWPNFYFFRDGECVIEIFKNEDKVRSINYNNQHIENENANFLRSMNFQDRLEYIKNLIISKNIINKFGL